MTALVLVLAVSACRTFQVRTDHDAARAFDDVARFYFVEPPAPASGTADPFADNDLLRKRVRRAIEGELMARGFVPVDDRGQADLLITYGVLLDEEFRADGMTSSTGFGFYRRGLGASVATTTNVRSFQEATLMLDLLDPSSEELVWRGWGKGMLSTRDRVRDEERLAEGVRAILGHFPPTAR